MLVYHKEHGNNRKEMRMGQGEISYLLRLLIRIQHNNDGCVKSTQIHDLATKSHPISNVNTKYNI